MINLVIPRNLGIHLFDNIVGEKSELRRNRLQILRPVVEQRYLLYEQNRTELSTIPQIQFLDEAIKDMHSCYGNNKYMNLARNVLNESQSVEQQGTCVYCGIGEPSTLDHYLPKEKFPELSVLGENLVPCCSRCNELKGKEWLNQDGQRTIINFYFDNVVQYQFLEMTIQYDTPTAAAPTVRFTIVRDPQISNRNFNLVNSHFSVLRLLERYRKKVNEELSNIITDISSNVQNIDKVTQINLLQQRATNLELKYGRNYWKACLYSSVARSAAIFDRYYGNGH